MLSPATVLVIAAHPDDEVLGCGGTIARLAEEGRDVHVALLADGVGARHAGPEVAASASVADELHQRRAAARAATTLLGARSLSFGDYPDNRMDTVALLDIVRSIEALIREHRPDTVFTHHGGDVNVDHRRIHEAVAAACRPQPGALVRNVLFFEVASSTEWAFPHQGPAFQPGLFVDVSSVWPRKAAALAAYDREMRAWPHSRSLAALEHLARWRGATCGTTAAEAFAVGRITA